MPQPIPIIYTGKNVAAPNWSELNRDIKNRTAQLGQQRQQKEQFESIQNERRRKEYLDNLDIDKLNSTNEDLLNMKFEMVKGYEDILTQGLTESGGEPTDKDLLEAKKLGLRINQDIAKFNTWNKNWELDKKTAADNLDIYDEKKVNEVINNWNPKEDGAYRGSKLDQTFRDISIEEVRASRFTKMRDPNTLWGTSVIAGKEVTSKEQYDEAYFNKITDKDGHERIVPDYGAQVGYLKATTTAEGKKGVLAEITYDKEYQKAIKDNKDLQETYEGIALNTTGNKEDAKYIYELENSGGAYFESGEPEAVKVTKAAAGVKDKRTDIKLTTGKGQFGDKSIGSSGTKAYFDAEGNPQKKTFGKDKIVYTGMEWAENPTTKKDEWMVVGYTPKTGSELDVGENPTLNDLLVASLAASVGKGSKEVEEIRIPYESIKEEMDRNYKFEGMDKFAKSKESVYTIDGTKVIEKDLLKRYKVKYPDKTDEELLTAIRKLK